MGQVAGHQREEEKGRKGERFERAHRGLLMRERKRLFVNIIASFGFFCIKMLPPLAASRSLPPIRGVLGSSPSVQGLRAYSENPTAAVIASPEGAKQSPPAGLRFTHILAKVAVVHLRLCGHKHFVRARHQHPLLALGERRGMGEARAFRAPFCTFALTRGFSIMANLPYFAAPRSISSVPQPPDGGFPPSLSY